MIRHHCHIAALAFIVVLTGCAHPGSSPQGNGSERRPVGARLSKPKAVQIAKRAAQRVGADLSQYAEPSATYEPSDPKLFSFYVLEGPGEAPPGNHVWVVNFGWGRNSNYPGGDLCIYVDDKTGRARIAPSM